MAASANRPLPGVSLSPQNTDGKRDLQNPQMRAGTKEAS